MQPVSRKDPIRVTTLETWTLFDRKTMEILQIGGGRRYALADRRDRVILDLADLVSDRRAASHELRREAMAAACAALYRALAFRVRAVRRFLRKAPTASRALRA